jgi:hypothetical protein
VILSEARKFRLNLIIAHQYLSQLTPEVHDAAFGNVGSIIAFRAGPDDAIAMATEFTPTFTPEDVVNLSIRDIYLKLSVGGKTSTPFSARTLTVKVPKENYLADIIANSREEYATSRREVEAELFGDKDTSLFDFNPPIPLRAIF